MAKIKYNIKLWADKAANLATDTTVYKENDFIFATDSGVLKKGDGVMLFSTITLSMRHICSTLSIPHGQPGSKESV